MPKDVELKTQRAFAILPHLVYYAQHRKTVSYKKIAAIINVNPHTELNHILGYIRDTICDPQGLPRINAIVVSGTKGEPGDGFIPEGAKNLPKEEKTRLFEKFRDEVFLYEDWGKLLIELGLNPITATEDDLDEEARRYNEIIERKGGGCGEQEEHRSLKEYIAKQPQTIGITALKKPKMEHPFLSADRCDVLIELFGNRAAIVEIKVRHRGELVKGIYQLVKYRALFEAEKTHGGSYPVDLHLVAYEIPPEVKSLAEKFEIQCHVFNKALVMGIP